MRSVVITGASTGIGWASAKLLLDRGFRVFGSVRKQADADRLKGEFGANFTPLIFDVTDEAAVLAAAREVRAALERRNARRPRQQCRHCGRRSRARTRRRRIPPPDGGQLSSARSSRPRLSARCSAPIRP